MMNPQEIPASLNGLRVRVDPPSGMLAHYLIPLLEQAGAIVSDADPVGTRYIASPPDSGAGLSKVKSPSDIFFLLDPDEETLRKALENAPRAIVLISSDPVPTDVARRAGIPLAILRPAPMFGRGVSGEMAEMFRRVLSGRYIHVRGEEGRLSLVMALDVARAAIAVAGRDGVWNVAYPESFSWLELAEAMSANAGARRRMTTLPAKWAALGRSLFGFIPAVRESIGKEVLDARAKNRTLSTDRLEADFPDLVRSFYNPVEVIARRDPSYPYEEQ